MWKFLTGALAAAWLLAPVSAQAQAVDKYPEKQIRIIVPYPPGGSVDVLGVEVPRSQLVRTASDHLPLVMDFRIVDHERTLESAATEMVLVSDG